MNKLLTALVMISFLLVGALYINLVICESSSNGSESEKKAIEVSSAPSSPELPDNYYLPQPLPIYCTLGGAS